MELAGHIDGTDWTVAAQSSSASEGYGALVTLSMRGTHPHMERSFHCETLFPTQADAILAGLKEGMILVDLVMSNTLAFQAAKPDAVEGFEPAGSHGGPIDISTDSLALNSKP